MKARGSGVTELCSDLLSLILLFSFAFPPNIHWSLSCCKAVTLTVFSSLFLTVHPLDPAPVLQQYPTSTHSIPSFLPSLLFFLLLLLSLFLSQVSDMDPKSYDAKSTWSNSTYRPKNECTFPPATLQTLFAAWYVTYLHTLPPPWS